MKMNAYNIYNKKYKYIMITIKIKIVELLNNV